MTAKSQARGYDIEFNEKTKKWEPDVSEDVPCKNCGKFPAKLSLEIPADLSHTGRPYTKICKIDACIAPIIRALNKEGIKTRACCCGHGRQDGNIILEDGRTFVIKRKRKKK